MLINDIRSGANIKLGNPDFAESLGKVIGHCKDAIVYKIQNVADYFYTSPKAWSLTDFPLPKPIAPLLWQEWKNTTSQGKEAGEILGCLTTEDKVSDEGLFDIQILLFLQQNGIIAPTIGIQYALKVTRTECEIVLNEQGKPFHYWNYTDQKQPIIDQESINHILALGFYPAMLANSFLHCRNVVSVKHSPAKNLQKARHRRNKPPLAQFYTLDIEPMKQILRTEGKSEEAGLKKALHICRGHFAHYTEDKPLFGKVSGRFWIPAHVRGSKDSGEIKKDYKIKI